MNKFLHAVGLPLALIAVLTLTGGAIVITAVMPESSGAFEMTGMLIQAGYSGSLRYGKAEGYNTWNFELIMTKDEANRVDTLYTTWLRKSGPTDVVDRPGYVHYGRESTGNWCGPLPPPGTRVLVNSPTGYTKDVIIRDMETGKKYQSQGTCVRPVYQYHWRVTIRETGKVLKEGIAVGRDSFEAGHAFTEYSSNRAYVFQIWQDGETAPPPLEPNP